MTNDIGNYRGGAVIEYDEIRQFLDAVGLFGGFQLYSGLHSTSLSGVTRRGCFPA